MQPQLQGEVLKVPFFQGSIMAMWLGHSLQRERRGFQQHHMPRFLGEFTNHGGFRVSDRARCVSATFPSSLLKGNANSTLFSKYSGAKISSCSPCILLLLCYIQERFDPILVLYLFPSLCFRFTSAPEKCPAMTCVLPPPAARPHWPTAATSPVCASARTPQW